MEADPPAKAFVKQFLRAAKLEVIESNLSIELLGKLNLTTAQQYEEVLQDATRIEHELSALSSVNAELQAVVAEIGTLGPIIQQLEHSVQFLEEITGRLEVKFKGVQGFTEGS